MAKVIQFPRKPVLALAQMPQRPLNVETRRFQIVRRVARVLGLVYDRQRGLPSDPCQQITERDGGVA
jgi:hypothetical protein